MAKILTISIAAYNVEKYIARALESLIDTDIIDDLEVFVVDDGGTDTTMQIAERYAKRYPKSIFCVYKENGGYGSTINYSIKMATGKYFKQLDGDDWFEHKNLKEFIRILKKTSADVVLTDSVKFYEVNQRYFEGLNYDYLKEGEYAIENLQIDTRLSMHTVAFKTSWLKIHEKPLTEHSLYTDTEYISYPVLFINTIYVLHKNIYVYRIGKGDQSFSIKSVQKHYSEMERVFNTCINIYNEIDIKDFSKRRIMFEIILEKAKNLFNFYLVLPISKKSINKIKNFQKFLETTYPEILNKVRNDSKTINILLSSNFLAYPLASLWVRLKWRKDR